MVPRLGLATLLNPLSLPRRITRTDAVAAPEVKATRSGREFPRNGDPGAAGKRLDATIAVGRKVTDE
jgi:hypothetical protein